MSEEKIKLSPEQILAARKINLAMFLEQHNPPLPSENIRAMMVCFIDYWEGETDLVELQYRLRRHAGYLPAIDEHGLYTFLDDKEFH